MSLVSWLNRYYEDRGAMKWLAFFFDLIAALALFFLMALTCVDVLGRYIFNSPLTGASELTEIGLAVVIFTVMPIVTWRSAHIVVDLIDGFISNTLLRILVFISTCITATALYLVSFRIWAIGERMLRRGITTDFLQIESGLVIQYIALFSWITAVTSLVYVAYVAFKPLISGAK